MRRCEACQGPGPSLWAESGAHVQRYCCVKCHPDPTDPFFAIHAYPELVKEFRSPRVTGPGAPKKPLGDHVEVYSPGLVDRLRRLGFSVVQTNVK